jgi:hypothetical protein
LNRQLQAGGQEPLSPFFYTSEQFADLESEHADELEALKPTKPVSEWQKEKTRQAQERELEEALAKEAALPFAAFAAAWAAQTGADAGQAVDVSNVVDTLYLAWYALRKAAWSGIETAFQG